MFISRRRRKPESIRPIAKAKKVIRSIVGVLHQKSFKEEVGIQTTEVFVGGSVGQGTAVTGHYDLDLVLYSRSLDYKEAAEKNGYGDLLEKIDIYFKKTLNDQYTFTGVTKVAMEFKYTLPEGGYLKVDLLLSPFWDNSEDFFRDLHQIKLQRRLIFSVSASKYQTKFIKDRDIRVHELIRRAKAWRNVEWRESDDPGRPKSYLISLLVIAAHHRVTEKSVRRMKFKRLAKLVGEEMATIVKEIMRNDQVNFIIPGTSEDVTTSDLLPPCPRIVDPVNPANNVYLSGVGKDPDAVDGQGKWRMLREKISKIKITLTAEIIMTKCTS